LYHTLACYANDTHHPNSAAYIPALKGPSCTPLLVKAIIRRWRAAGAQFIIAAPSLAESIRGGPRDAEANRLIKAVDCVVSTTEPIARRASESLGTLQSKSTVDAIIVASAQAAHATDILTSDPDDMRLLAGASMNIHPL
jgi:predicted nucleic acid-binding protein